MCRPKPGQVACACHEHAPGPVSVRPEVVALALDGLADPALPGRWRRPLGDWVEAAGGGPDLVELIVLAVNEALSNAVEHAYRDRPVGPVVLRARRTGPASPPSAATGSGSGAVLEVVVTDRGRWQLPAPHAGYRGRGSAIIRATADDVDLTSTSAGTTVTMTWVLLDAAS